MTDDRVTAPLLGGIALLERAIGYALGSLQLVTPGALHRPTPCQGWDLRALLVHMDDSLAALQEAGDGRTVAPLPGPPAADPVTGLRHRACRLLGTWAKAGCPELVSVAGSPLTSGIVTGAGAVEIAVHGWDVARACGRHRPIPPGLAEEMLDLAPLFVGDEDRPARFAPPVELPRSAGSGDRLVAFLGRVP